LGPPPAGAPIYPIEWGINNVWINRIADFNWVAAFPPGSIAVIKNISCPGISRDFGLLCINNRTD
jgi:hypothetical protein